MTVQSASMGEQHAAQAVIQELLRRHSATPARNGFGRFFGYSPLDPDSVSWYLGAIGELAVGEILATLPPGWSAFHSLPIGRKGSDIDHLVIGPGGIFTINTKHHRGQGVWVAGKALLVSGHKVPHIRNAEYEADRVTRLLGERMPFLPATQPVLAFVNPKSITIKKLPERVKIIDSTGLRRWLLGQTVVLGPPELARLAAIVDHPATWPTPLSAPNPAAEPMVRFAALEAEVRAAQGRSTLWKLFGIVASAGVLVLAGPFLLNASLGV